MRSHWIVLNGIWAAGPLEWLLYGNCWYWNEEGWASIRATGHSGPCGICMVWDVRGLLDPEYELTRGREGNLNLCISCIIIYFNFIYELVHACCLNSDICGIKTWNCNINIIGKIYDIRVYVPTEQRGRKLTPTIGCFTGITYDLRKGVRDESELAVRRCKFTL